MAGKIGQQTFMLDKKVYITHTANAGGTEEAKGPLADYFDTLFDDDMCGEKTWEKAESQLVISALDNLFNKSTCTESEIDAMFGGDLLNQCISVSFGARGRQIPYFGLYGACSTFVEGMMLGSFMISGGFANKTIAVTSSHFCSAERQYRAPVQLGNQRTPTAQRTVTASGAALLSESTIGEKDKSQIYIDSITPGIITDYMVKDPNNMGAAMAPAAADTILKHLKDTGRDINYYDLILTGDLGDVGYDICRQLLKNKIEDVVENYNDCGRLIYDRDLQDVHAGGSGCGCVASVFSGYLFDKLVKGELNRILLVGTGALFSPTSSFQGESIPGIGHAIAICTEK